MKGWKSVLCLVMMLGYGAGSLLARSSTPPASRTGDFGEPNCTACHAGNVLNAEGGTFRIAGVPANYEPGKTYAITVTLQRAGQSRWGFQLSVRAVATSQQAGTLTPKDANSQITTANGVQYISHTSAGTFAGTSAGGTWTFDWTAPAANAGSIRFSAAGNAANNSNSNAGDFIYTTTVTTEQVLIPKPITAVFAHVALGQGYTTTFTLTNTGSTPVEGNLILTGQDGNPLEATLKASAERLLVPAHETVAPDSPVAPEANAAKLANSTTLTVPPGGTQFVTAAAANAADPLRQGWARLESTGGSPAGVATFQYAPGGVLTGLAGVLSSETIENATIPVDDDVSADRMTGYAVANPSSESVTIKLVTLKEDGTAGATLQSITLGPGQQKAQFLFQDPAASQRFRGSVVLMGQGGKKFVVVALVLNKGLYTAIPVIPAKAAGVN